MAQDRATVDPNAGAPARFELPRAVRPIGPLIDLAAGLNASMHAKLLVGFLVGAFLPLLGMGVLSLLVIGQMSQRQAEIITLQEKVDWSRRMEYQVTAQSHFRAMALLTHDETMHTKIADAKKTFLEGLGQVERRSGPEQAEFYRQVREADASFAGSSALVLDLYRAGQLDEALRVHIDEEHKISHVLEAQMRDLQAVTLAESARAREAFEADRSLLTTIVVLFGLASLGAALLLGAVLSWSFIRPVREMDAALAAIASGEFGRQVEVANRDELGTLSRNLNTASQQLAQLYTELRTLNENLQETVERQVAEIHQQRLHQEIVHHELQRAWEIQKQLLPKSLPSWPGQLELAARFRPARETSGDFYDVLALTSEASTGNGVVPLQIAVGDVAGKGMGAALIMAVARGTLRATAYPILVGGTSGASSVTTVPPSPAATLRFVSRILNEDIGAQDFVACTLAVVEPASPGQAGGGGPRLRLANAAQPPVLLCRNGQVTEITAAGEHLPLGVLTDPDYYDVTLDLQSRDVVVFTSDGLAEAPAQPGAVVPVAAELAAGAGGERAQPAPTAGELFGFPRVAASTAYWTGHTEQTEDLADGIWQDVAAWCGDSPQHDDITLLVMRVL